MLQLNCLTAWGVASPSGQMSICVKPSCAQFLILKDKAIPSVPHLLRAMMRRQEIGGLAVHWRVFGSSGHVTAPEAGVLQVHDSIH